MTEQTKPPMLFWFVAIVALLWNGMGLLNFIGQLGADGLASLPENHRYIVENRPGWSTAAFGLGAAASVLGAILMLMRRRMAYPVFVVAFLSVLVTLLYSAPVQMSSGRFTLAENVMTILLPIVISALLVWYTGRVRERGWLV